MLLRDWSGLPGWEGVLQIWMVELLYWLQPRLPAEYRAYLGTTPTFAIDAPADERPDVGVRDQPAEQGVPSPAADAWQEPDEEVAVAALPGDKAVQVERAGRLVAAVELVSPRNKDRPSACAAYANGYAGYLLKGVHLLLVDIHRLPAWFSFADRIAEELEFEQPPCPSPFAVSTASASRLPRADVFSPSGVDRWSSANRSRKYRWHSRSTKPFRSTSNRPTPAPPRPPTCTESLSRKSPIAPRW